MSCAAAMTTSASPSRRGPAPPPGGRRVDGADAAGAALSACPEVADTDGSPFDFSNFKGVTSPHVRVLRLTLCATSMSLERLETAPACRAAVPPSAPVAGRSSDGVSASWPGAVRRASSSAASGSSAARRRRARSTRASSPRARAIIRSFAAMPSGVSTRFLTRRSRWLGSRRTNPRFSSVSAIVVTNDASHPIRCASSFIASPPSSLNSASRSCGAISNSAAMQCAHAPASLTRSVSASRMSRFSAGADVFSPRRVRSLDLHAHDLLNS